MAPRTSILDLFPVELLAHIKDSIPQGDVRTHVYFYHSFVPITSELYAHPNAEAEKKFWETVCVQAGLGLTLAEILITLDVNWKVLAMQAVLGDGDCSHPHCGEVVLDENAIYMASQIDKDLHDVSRNELFTMIPDGTNTSPKGTIINPMLSFLHFYDTRTHADGTVRFPEDDIFLWYPHNPQKRSQQLLKTHPAAARSFASFPPARRILVQGFLQSHFITVENAYGVTVWDVAWAIQQSLDHEVSVADMRRLLEDNNYRTVFPPHCDFLKMMASLTTLRHFLSFYRINAVEITDWETHGLHVYCDFVPIRKANPDTPAIIF